MKIREKRWSLLFIYVVLIEELNWIWKSFNKTVKTHYFDNVHFPVYIIWISFICNYTYYFDLQYHLLLYLDVSCRLSEWSLISELCARLKVAEIVFELIIILKITLSNLIEFLLQLFLECCYIFIDFLISSFIVLNFNGYHIVIINLIEEKNEI